MITLPVTCSTLGHILGITMLAIGIPTSIIWWTTRDPNYFMSVVPLAFGVVYLIFFVVMYYCEHDFPIRCKCNE